MPVNTEVLKQFQAEAKTHGAILVAVSKTRPVAEIRAAYEAGQRDFGENYVQELIDKQALLPPDINWHFIGHLQSNKVKYIAPFVHLIHGVDSLNLLKEINKQALKNNRLINCLLQVFIAREETKFGLDQEETKDILYSEKLKELKNASIIGLMGMASNTENMEQVASEFESLASMYRELKIRNPQFKYLSMGMTSDYPIALKAGSTLIRIGSALFGEREKK